LNNPAIEKEREKKVQQGMSPTSKPHQNMVNAREGSELDPRKIPIPYCPRKRVSKPGLDKSTKKDRKRARQKTAFIDKIRSIEGLNGADSLLRKTYEVEGLIENEFFLGRNPKTRKEQRYEGKGGL